MSRWYKRSNFSSVKDTAENRLTTRWCYWQRQQNSAARAQLTMLTHHPESKHRMRLLGLVEFQEGSWSASARFAELVTTA